MQLMATTAFGLEALVKRELSNLGYDRLKVKDGVVEFEGEAEDIARTNLWLRTAERVEIKLGEFYAESFEELFEKTRALPWADWIPEDGNFHISGKSQKSKLMSVRSAQSIVEKAVITKLQERYHREWFTKEGAHYPIEVAIVRDVVTLSLDTSGAALHKRGYRNRAGDAPIKETLAHAMVDLSYWNPDRPLYDPFCGSGTILLEAAMKARNIAPGLERAFAAAEWPLVGKAVFQKERSRALSMIRHDVTFEILGSDIDKRQVLRARDHAEKLGLSDISFFVKDMRKVDLKNNYGVLITNPPYGERLGERKEAQQLIRDLGEKMRRLNTWSVYVITSDEEFERLYKKRADRKRKLYNGRIKVDYYQIHGPRPPRNMQTKR